MQQTLSQERTNARLGNLYRAGSGGERLLRRQRIGNRGIVGGRPPLPCVAPFILSPSDFLRPALRSKIVTESALT